MLSLTFRDVDGVACTVVAQPTDTVADLLAA
eukprot:COSAG02_NODE_42194_length_386_cov_3.627178_1_plen_30_part_10